MNKKFMSVFLVITILVSAFAVAVPVQAYKSGHCSSSSCYCSKWGYGDGDCYNCTDDCMCASGVYCAPSSAIIDYDWGYTHRLEGPHFARSGYTVYFSIIDMQYFHVYVNFTSTNGGSNEGTINVYVPGGSSFEITSTNGIISKNFKTSSRITGLVTVYIVSSNVTANVYMTHGNS